MSRLSTLTIGSLMATATLAAQTPQIPNAHASDTAKARVAAAGAPRATHARGTAVGLDNRPVTPAVPAVPATRATPATPAVPAAPPGRPASPGRSGRHRP